MKRLVGSYTKTPAPPAIVKEMIDLGISDFLTKPLNVSKLLSVLEDCVSKPDQKTPGLEPGKAK